jgi:putative tryptophan/tyrosine transport system substrate-binding protein
MRLTARVAAVVLVLASAIVAAAEPPSGKVLRIGILTPISPSFDPAKNAWDGAFTEGLREHGYVIGRNVVIEHRSAAGQPERLPLLAAELVALKVDIIVASPTAAALAAKDATRTIPIVMVGAADPVRTGVITSLAHPGGNVTGLAVNAAEISAKRVQLLREAVPNLSRVAVLWNSSFRSMSLGFQEIEHAAPTLGVSVHSIRVSGSDDLEQAFPAIMRGGAGGLIVLYGPMRGNDLPRITEFVRRSRMPTIFELGVGGNDNRAGEGALIGFGPSFAKMARRAGVYIDKIANGARPVDLPVEEPREVELVINLKAAKELGLTLPPSLLFRADRVTE